MVDEINCKTCRWYRFDAHVEMKTIFYRDHCDPPAGYSSIPIKAVLEIPNEKRQVRAYFECDTYEEMG